MKIELKEVLIREVVENYIDSDEEGVFGLNGKLNIRPKYQREYIYDEKKRNAVIDTINKGFPLNVMYWSKNDDGTFEVLDGQQRTISFCQYVKNEYSINERAFENLTKPEQDRILDYKLMVYICEGNDEERLAWFKTINIASVKLTDQELLNASYTGSWLTSAKTYFSKTNCVAYRLAKDYVIGSPIRQEYLETTLSWINNGNIKNYMRTHQNSPNANELWTYFRNVIEWVKLTFTVYRKEMKGVNWGELYNKFKEVVYDTNDLEKEVQKLMIDDDVTNNKGIYPYVLTRNEKYLNIRAFSEKQRRSAYEKQKGICAHCGKFFDIKEMEADHITPWSEGGQTSNENCQMLCKDCNRKKSNK